MLGWIGGGAHMPAAINDLIDKVICEQRSIIKRSIDMPAAINAMRSSDMPAAMSSPAAPHFFTRNMLRRSVCACAVVLVLTFLTDIEYSLYALPLITVLYNIFWAAAGQALVCVNERALSK